MATPGSTLVRLRNIDPNLEHNDSMEAVNAVLREYNEVIGEWHEGAKSGTLRPMTIYPSAIMYDSAAQREQKWALYLQRNQELADQYTNADWEREKAAFGILGDAISQSNQRCYTIYLASTQNPVFSHSWHMRVSGGKDTPELRARFYQGDIEWHEFVLVLKQRKVWSTSAR
jgi:hypothetical protein